MEFDHNVKEPDGRKRSRYNFAGVKPGDSTHVTTDAERVRVMMAFKYWATNIKKTTDAYATSHKVGDEDERGPGYRIWFKSKHRDTAALMKAGEDI